jgi:predicted GH43/DUF377 family glycosyl hydrolase
MLETTPATGLLRRHQENPILTASDLPYAVNSVFNPAAVEFEGDTLLLMRVEDRRGISHLTIARSHDGFGDWRVEPLPAFEPSPELHPHERLGVEDPRITYLAEAGLYVIAYTAFSETGPLVALATTRDFRSFERIGPVLPPENKDAALFPIQINGRWLMLHRPVTGSRDHGAHIWLASSQDLRHWSDHRPVIRARREIGWDAHRIGLSPPPMRTEAGWLVLYHGAGEAAHRPIYRLGLALLQIDDPTRVLMRSSEWIFGPHAPYEREGEVDHVVFPCGWIARGDELRIYYGAADTSVAMATASLSELLEWLEDHNDGEPSGLSTNGRRVA